jgi:hypothetical protein
MHASHVLHVALTRCHPSTFLQARGQLPQCFTQFAALVRHPSRSQGCRYGTLDVCRLCYDLYNSFHALETAATDLSSALVGSPRPARTFGLGEPRACRRCRYTPPRARDRWTRVLSERCMWYTCPHPTQRFPLITHSRPPSLSFADAAAVSSMASDRVQDRTVASLNASRLATQHASRYIPGVGLTHVTDTTATAPVFRVRAVEVRVPQPCRC